MTRDIDAPLLSSAQARLAEGLEPLAGRRIALIAPAGGVRPERAAIARAALQAAGISPWLGPHALDRHRYLAGTTSARLADFHAAFEAPDVDAVWCLRGGYGSAHLIEHIEWSRIARDRPLIGFSDISALLEAFRQRGLPAVHAPVATQLALPGKTPAKALERRESVASLAALLNGASIDWAIAREYGPDDARSGVLTGGNLTTLASLAGTAAALRLDKPALLLLEDIGEPEYRLERALHQLLSTLDLRRLQAVCLGDFEGCALPSGAASLAALSAEWTRDYDIPVYAGLPFGHGLRNRAWPLGQPAQLRSGRLTTDRA